MTNPVRIGAAFLGLILGGGVGLWLVGVLSERFDILTQINALGVLMIVAGFLAPALLLGYLAILLVKKIEEIRAKKMRKARRSGKYYSTKRKRR